MERALDDGDPLHPMYGPLSCSDGTKVVFDCGKLSSENPILFIPKEMIVQDINEKFEESDFFIYKDCIEEYPADKLMLVLDLNEKYGEEYYLCLTEDAKKAVLLELNLNEEYGMESQHGMPEEEEEEKVEVPMLSTENEIEEEREEGLQPKIKVIVLPNKDMPRKPLELFCKMPSDHSELYLEILPESHYYREEEEGDEKEAVEPIRRKTVDHGFQATVTHSVGFSQTARSKLCNACTQTELKLFTTDKKDEIWKSDEMRSFLPEVEERILDVLIENSSGGLEKPWISLKNKVSEIESGKDSPLTVYKSFMCVGEKESKMITSIDWHPFLKDIFVVSTAQNCSFEEKTDRLSVFLLEPCLLYIWSFEDQLLPRLLLDSCDEIACVKFNPTMPHIVIGGGVNGQLILWDLTKDEDKLKVPLEYDWARQATPYNESALGDVSSFKSAVSHYCASSNFDHSHLLSVHYLEWVPAGIEIQAKGEVKSVSSHEFFQIVSCGLDGSLRFWDIRFKLEIPGVEIDSQSYTSSLYESLDMTWRPFHIVDIAPSDGQKHLSLTVFSLKMNCSKVAEIKASGSESLDDAADKISTIFFAGTEDGKVLRADFNLSKISTGKRLAPAHPTYYTSVHGVHIHGGAVVKIAHSPFLSNIFFSLGDKTAAIWREDLTKGPLFIDISKSNITSGHWSPTRPAVFTLGLHDGSLRVWDLLQSSRNPQLLQSVASTAITTITTRWISENEQVLAIGDGDGFVHILQLPKYLWKPVEDELLRVQQFVAREAKRVEFQAKKQAVTVAEKSAEVKAFEEEERKKKEKTVELAKEVKIEKPEEEKQQELFLNEYQEFLELEESLLLELGYLVLEENAVEEEEDS